MNVMSTPFTGLTGPTLRSGFLELSESTYAGGLLQPLHGHDPAYFSAVVSGAYEERTGSATRVVRRGALLFHPAGEEHAVRFKANHTRVFRLRPLAPMLEAERLTRATFAAMLAQARARASRIVCRIRDEYMTGDPLAPLTIDGLGCELIAVLTTVCEPHCHAGAVRARDIIEAHLDRSPSLALLAREAGCHPITLARAFRREFGCSIGSYVRRRRLELAASMLRATDIPICMVAIRTGFADQAHFTRALRRALGFTPAALRAFKTN